MPIVYRETGADYTDPSGEGAMRRGEALLGAVLAIALAAAEVPPPVPSMIGSTWVLNTARSTFTPGPGWRSQTRTYKLGPSGEVIVEWVGVGGHGEPMHVVFQASLDGQDYPMTGSANYDTISAIKVNDLTVRSDEKRAGKVRQSKFISSTARICGCTAFRWSSSGSATGVSVSNSMGVSSGCSSASTP